MDAVADILKETNRDNANVGNSPSAKVLQISEAASKNYYLKRVLPPEEAAAHLNGDIYIHDLSLVRQDLYLSANPSGPSFAGGF